MKPKIEFDHDRPDYGLTPAHSFTHAEADVYNPRPVHRRKKKPRIESRHVLDMLLLWALFSVPALIMLLDSNWSTLSAIMFGFICMFVGNLWKEVCPVNNRFVRHGITLFGVMLAATAFIGMFVPRLLLFFIAVALAPIAVWRYASGKE
jgi:hypothetical protein